MNRRSINIFLLQDVPSGILAAQISMSTIQAIAMALDSALLWCTDAIVAAKGATHDKNSN